jgi:hypothetical protein
VSGAGCGTPSRLPSWPAQPLHDACVRVRCDTWRTGGTYACLLPRGTKDTDPRPPLRHGMPGEQQRRREHSAACGPERACGNWTRSGWRTGAAPEDRLASVRGEITCRLSSARSSVKFFCRAGRRSAHRPGISWRAPAMPAHVRVRLASLLTTPARQQRTYTPARAPRSRFASSSSIRARGRWCRRIFLETCSRALSLQDEAWRTWRFVALVHVGARPCSGRRRIEPTALLGDRLVRLLDQVAGGRSGDTGPPQEHVCSSND